nr:uncharacterized protein LOC109399303 [Aedes albopictus]
MLDETGFPKVAWSGYQEESLHLLQLPFLVFIQLINTVSHFYFSLIDQINGLRDCWTNPKRLPEIVSQNTTTIKTRSYYHRNRVNVRRKHRYTTVIPGVTEENIEFPFFIPWGRHATEDPDHVQVKVLELLPGTLLPVSSLPLVDVVYIDSKHLRVLSDALREASNGAPRIFSS